MQANLKRSLFFWIQFCVSIGALTSLICGIVYGVGSFVLDLQTRTTAIQQHAVIESKIKLIQQESNQKIDDGLKVQKTEIEKMVDRNHSELREDIRTINQRLDAILVKVSKGM